MSLRWPPFALAAAFVVADQFSKAWVVAEVPLGARVASWAGLLHLTHTRNTGAAFGLLRDRVLDLGLLTISGVQLLGLVSLAVAIALAVWLASSRSLGGATRLGLGAIMGGAIGNGIDRWRLGYVTDFVHAQAGWFDFPVFNVADVGISVGATGLLLASFFGGRHADRGAGRRHAASADRSPDTLQARAVQERGPVGAPDVGPGEGRAGGPVEVSDAPVVKDGADRAVSDAPARSANDR